MPVLAALAVLGVVACEPAPPPDGRDLGVALDAAPPTRVAKGDVVALSGTVTNHGTAPATAVTVDYGITGGFSLDAFDVAGADCNPVTSSHVACTLPEPLGAGDSVGFTALATAGQVNGSYIHLLGANSDGTEPEGDENEGFVVVPVDVRPAPAEPQPLEIGNGTNHLGTGRLLETSGSGRPGEGYYLAVNPFCTSKADGDRFQSAYTGRGCTGSVNVEYQAAGYSYVVDVPAGRTSAIDVLLFDAKYDWSSPDAVDAALGSQGNEPFTYSLYGADGTPQNQSDNPLICERTFELGTAFDTSYLGSDRWNRLCSISPTAPAGEYVLQVRNGGSQIAPVADGANHFAIVATYAADGGHPVTSLCDRATRSDCPVVHGPGTASMRIESETQIARIPVGTVAPEHEGRLMRIELFDPGEGMDILRVLAPVGPGSWEAVEFTWTSPGVSGSGAATKALDLRNSKFNGKLVIIDVDLVGYAPPAENQRWLVEYQAGFQPVTDRTTWVAGIADHP